MNQEAGEGLATRATAPSRATTAPSTRRQADDPPTLPVSRHAARWGFLLILLGALVIVLAFIDIAFSLPFSMPRSWYSGRSLWFLMAGAAFAAGVKLVRTPHFDNESASRGTSPGERNSHTPAARRSRFSSLILYTRTGCHLCDVAHDLLQKYSRELPPIQLIDIDTDPRLVEQFTTCVPVIEIDGKIRFRGQVNEVLLLRLLRHGDAAA